jgi:hypothetical protein
LGYTAPKRLNPVVLLPDTFPSRAEQALIAAAQVTGQQIEPLDLSDKAGQPSPPIAQDGGETGFPSFPDIDE